MQVATPPTASEFQGGIIGVTLRPVSGAHLISPITALATQPGTGAWLGGAEEMILSETKALHTHKKRKKKRMPRIDIYESKKKKIRAHRASSKATRLFLTKQ